MGYLYEMILEDMFFGGIMLLTVIIIVVVLGSILYEIVKEKILVKEKVEVVSEVLIKGKETSSSSTMLVNNVGDTGIVMPTNDYYIIYEYKEKVYENMTTSKIYRRLNEGEVVEANIIEYLDKEGNIIKVRADFRGILD